MKRIWGRVLVKESQLGVPNLVVAAFDCDRFQPTAGAVEPPPGVAPASGEALAMPLTLEARGVPRETIEQVGTRIGSVLTDRDGNFSFDLQPGDSGIVRPDLVLVVFAPEDSQGINQPLPLPPERRVLSISRVPRSDAGETEAYLIRLLQAQLDAYRIPSGAPDPARRDAPADVAQFFTSVQQGWLFRDKAREVLSARMTADLKRTTDLKLEAASKLSNLSAVRSDLRDHPYRLTPKRTLASVQRTAAQDGLDRIAKTGAYKGMLRLKVGRGDLEKLGLKLDASGMVSGKTSVAALLSRMASTAGSTDLVRAHGLLDACAPHPPDAAPTTTVTNTSESPAGLTSAEAAQTVLDRVVGQIDELAPAGDAGARPDPSTVAAELAALKLTGGPADAVAYHDFNVLQVAFKHVWMEAFDESLRAKAEQLYQQAVRVYQDAGVDAPPIDAIDDVDKLRTLLADLGAGDLDHAIPFEVQQAFNASQATWNALSQEQRVTVQQQAQIVVQQQLNPFAPQNPQAVQSALLTGKQILSQPDGPRSRLEKLILELGTALNEHYAFDVFAPGSYNYAVEITYRQRWEPKGYQAGDLVATIPLAPNETRKYSKKRTVKTTRAEKEIARSSSTVSAQRSETGRAEAEIMQKATESTNFHLNTHGSFNIGVGNIDVTSDFTVDQKQESVSNKKEFHEATLKAAEEYRKERSLEVDTSITVETEEASTSEISNPNNELTVTYLFYELQRTYQISERLHRARPVILVAQDVPAPDQIDEAWLITYQWILARVLLDNSLRPALEYLTSGMAGDEVALDLLRTQFEAQKQVVEKLEAQASSEIQTRDILRTALSAAQMAEAVNKEAKMPIGAKILSLGMAPDPADFAADMLAAGSKIAQDQLQYNDNALAETQKKLREASDAFCQATKDYSAMLQKQFARHVAIDQLRVHVKQNILFYMQAIWNQEPPDQRFFRLYKLPVMCPGLPAGEVVAQDVEDDPALLADGETVTVGFGDFPAPDLSGGTVDLEEIADLDTLLGYKGNYMIFPLKRPCYLTSYMLREFVDGYFGVKDPDELGNYTVEELEDYVDCVSKRTDVSDADKKKLRDLLKSRLAAARVTSDLIIVPTGQLFIEALPGRHPLLEDFKLRHRLEDVRKVHAEVRHAELENLRLASRLVQDKPVLSDPDIEKRIVVDKGIDVVADGA
jgi:hypothetical protein